MCHSAKSRLSKLNTRSDAAILKLAKLCVTPNMLAGRKRNTILYAVISISTL